MDDSEWKKFLKSRFFSCFRFSVPIIFFPEGDHLYSLCTCTWWLDPMTLSMSDRGVSQIHPRSIELARYQGDKKSPPGAERGEGVLLDSILSLFYYPVRSAFKIILRTQVVFSFFGWILHFCHIFSCIFSIFFIIRELLRLYIHVCTMCFPTMMRTNQFFYYG